MRAYSTVQSWVDGLWAYQGNKVKGTLAIAVLPFLAVVLFARNSNVLVIATALWAVGWFLFVGWRGMIWARTAAKEADRTREHC